MAPTERPHPHGDDSTILIVDDEPGIRSVVQRVLQRDGLTTLVAGNGEDALAVAQAHQGDIDLLLTDMQLGDMTGAALAARLVTSRPSLRTVVMSGASEGSARAESAGEQLQFLAKPFDPTELVALVRRMLGRA